MPVLPFRFLVSASLLAYKAPKVCELIHFPNTSPRPAGDTPSPRLVPIRNHFFSLALIFKPTLAPCTSKVRVFSLISCILCDSSARSSEKSRFPKDVVEVHRIPFFLSKVVLVAQSLVRHHVVSQPPRLNVSADTIECLFENYKVDIQGGLPLEALLHKNPQCCCLIRTASASSEARLFFSQFFIQRDLGALQDHSAKHLTCHVQQHDATPIFAVAQITYLGQLD